MKIQCDVCNKEEASVFCSADEAALCGGCDRRVHHANKLAGKHIRFSLQRSPSSSKESPRCDICQVFDLLPQTPSYVYIINSYQKYRAVQCMQVHVQRTILDTIIFGFVFGNCVPNIALSQCPYIFGFWHF